MVGAGFAVTITVAEAVALPPLPFSVTVYVVLAAGPTAWVPPLAPSVYELPSEPLIVTCVALVAVTVRIDELPAAIDVGFAVIVTAGGGKFAETETVTVAVADPPEPAAVAV